MVVHGVERKTVTKDGADGKQDDAKGMSHGLAFLLDHQRDDQADAITSPSMRR